MALPSQVARPMSVSATKFSASRRAMPARRVLGWGALLLVVIGFTWWALSGRGSVGGAATKELSAEDAARLAAMEAAQAAPALPTGGQPVPTGTPVVTNPPSMKSDPAPASLTMGAPVARGDSSAARESGPRLTVESILASNTPRGSAPGHSGSGDAPGGAALSRGTGTPPSTPSGAEPGVGGSNPPGTEPPSSSSTMPAGAAPSAGVSPPVGSLPASSAVGFLVDQGDAFIARGKPVEARDAYNRALFDARATEADRVVLRDKLASLAEAITWSPRVEPGDAMSETYAFQSGDRLVKLPSTRNLAVDWRLIARVNRITDPGKIRLNQRIKLIKGPFHAVVHKGAFRMDVFNDAKDSAGNRIYVKSFAVGLGEHGSTPTGSFIVKPKSKLVNPKWVNPRTGERFDADDPKNPIGERWIGLDGTDPTTKLLSGYGIHGTIEPESIGQEKSMGCVRLIDRDVEFIYELLFEGASTVEIRP